MLQGNAIHNLQEENKLQIAQNPTVEQTLYGESNVITIPPRSENRSDVPEETIHEGPNRGYQSSTSIQFQDPRLSRAISGVRKSGLDFLDDIPSIHIEQTFELHDYTVSSENRFTIRAPTHEAIYGASESSTEKDRMIWGGARPFVMHLLDKGHLETLTLHRKLALGILFCKPQYLEVWSPPGNLLGRVRETFSCFSAEFIIENPNGEIIYQIEGPPTLIRCCIPKEMHLKVLSADNFTQRGSITRIWNTDISTYTINVYFTDPNLPAKIKALFLGAAFLFEYMYFQSKWCC